MLAEIVNLLEQGVPGTWKTEQAGVEMVNRVQRQLLEGQLHLEQARRRLLNQSRRRPRNRDGLT